MNYARNILDLIGYDSFTKGRVYPYSFVRYSGTSVYDDYFSHLFKVKSSSTNKWYPVQIMNNGSEIKSFNCTCEQFKKAKTCKHIGAVLCQHIRYIYSKEIKNPLKISKTILSAFDIKKTNKPKEKINVEFEFNVKDEVYVKISMGLDKPYIVNNCTKLSNIMSTIKEEDTYEFGKRFTLDLKKHYFSNEDMRLLKYLCDQEDDNRYYYYNSDIRISLREFEYFLSLLNRPFKISNYYGLIKNVYHQMPTNYFLSKDKDNYTLEIDDYDKYDVLDSNNKFVVYNNDLYILNSDEASYIELLRENEIKTLVFEKNDLSKFNSGLLRKIKNNIKIDETLTEIKLPTKPITKLYLDIKNSLECKVIFDYNGEEINYFDTANILRDEDEEQNVISNLLNYGFYEKGKKLIMEEDELIYNFLENEISNLSSNYEVYTSKKIDNTNILKKVSTTSNFTIGQDGIMSYSFNADGIDSDELKDVFKALQKKQRYYKLKNNNVISFADNEELNDLNSLFTDLDLLNKNLDTGTIEIPKYRALYIDSLKQNKYKTIKTNNLFDKFIENFKKYKKLDIEFDDFDDKTLRDYQKEGVKWLTTIYKCDLGGILADEMGLGKSIQTISFIKQVLKEKPDAKIIIVAPTSLIYNWKNEFDKFGSELKYTVVAETKTKRKEILTKKDNYNIFITTYGLIRNDNDEYECMDFELCIIDEAQAIKNYQAGMTKEVKKIKAKCKIALTGTPVENNVSELWSIFDFIMPGYLNTIVKFREKYNIKDVTEEDLKILKTLNYQIKPFILRRKKIDVAKSLPDKIENNIYLDLPKKQKMLYLKELNDTKKEMDEIIATEGFQKARMKILQLLMKLRQVCIDPSVMYENYDGESVKIEELINILKSNIGEHKILIFSSFKRVLDNLKEKLEGNNISYYMIDGSVKSKDRMNMVESFNKDDTNCFLITLKSGGTGLNLIGADIVIHLDIWWNPQVENQATDRTHRIGQTKKVTVIKLITKGTIEERIIELQEKKKVLSENLIEGKSCSENLSSLSEKDIKKLLSSFDD